MASGDYEHDDLEEPTPPDNATVSSRDILIAAGAVSFLIALVIGAISILKTMQADMGTVSLAVAILVIAFVSALFFVDKLSDSGLIKILQSFKTGRKPTEK